MVRDPATNQRRRQVMPALTPTQMAKIRAILESDAPRSIRAIADMSFSGRSIGKELLLGTHWPGVIPLGDAQAMTRFTNYVTPRS
jgi:hypothetical protein